MTKKVVGNADQRAKDIVYGYVRKMEKSLKLSPIPAEMSNLCLLFYYFPELFYNARSDYFKISEDDLTLMHFNNSESRGFFHR